jgi:hypothetical protein
MVTSASPQLPTPERVFNALNAYEQTEAMKAAIELEIFTAIAEGNVSAQRSLNAARRRNAAWRCSAIT